MDAESAKDIRHICLRLLTRREYSQLELLNRLDVKGFSHAESQIIIDDLAEQGWQSDLRFAESYARYRIKKGYGPIKIGYELQQRGIESFDFDTVVFDLADDWDDLLRQVYERKYSDEKTLLSKEWLKRSRFLQQRGFSGELINRLFKVLNIKLLYS
ncbi:MAG: regulatory protein RecX [Methylomarinum sp.]|nr:regulatory protein RecX [Methylomarinum sp.]